MADKVHRTRFELSAVDGATKVFRDVEGGLKDLKSATDTVKNALAAVGVTIGTGAMIQLYHDVLHATAALDDMAESTGATVESLSKIQSVAKVGGHDFEGLTKAIGHMITSLKAADEHGQVSAHALEFLGIKAKDANGRFRDMGQIIIELAQALAKYDDSAEKVALVQDVFADKHGKIAAQYMSLLKDLAERGDMAAKVTAQQAAEAEVLEKNIHRLNVAMEDGRRIIMMQYTPALVDLTNQLLAAHKAAGNFYDGFGAFFSLSGKQAADPVAAIRAIDARLAKLRADRDVLAGPSLGAKFNRMMAPEDLSVLNQQILFAEQQRRTLQELLVRRVSGNAEGMYEDAAGFHPNPARPIGYKSPGNMPERAGLSPYAQRVLELQQQTAKEAAGGSEFIETRLAIEAGKYKALDHATGKLRELTQAEKQHLLQLAALRDQQAENLRFREDINKANEEAAKQELALTTRLVERAEAYKDILSASRPLIREEEELQELRRRGIITERDYQEIIIRRSEVAREKIVAMGQEAELAAQAGHQMGLSFTSALDQIVFNSGRAIHAMDLLKAVSLDVAKVIFANRITNPLAGGIEKGITEFLKGPRVLPDAQQAGSGVFGGFDSGAIANMDFVGTFASGTPYVPRTGLAIVHQGERITPASENAGGSTFIIDARGADSAGLLRLERMIRDLNGSVEYRAVRAVADARVRGMAV